MANTIYETIGDICEPCYALFSGIEPDYWEGMEESLNHCEAAAEILNTIGSYAISLTLDSDEPIQHFGGYCEICGFMPLAGTVYEGTLTVFEKNI